ncbi:MAG: hypothetical protein NUV46_03295 [Nanoarchaeota archaeon]|nr:hypothetical protein [Nanoarchaeota archaeon]
MTDYNELKNRIDKVYEQKKEEEQKAIENIWSGFSEEKSALEKIIYDEFGKIILSIGPLVHKNKNSKYAEIIEYKVSYNNDSKSSQVKITKFKLPDGRIMSNELFMSKLYECPHLYTYKICGKGEEIDNRIKEFREKFHIDSIKNVNHNCSHK